MVTISIDPGNRRSSHAAAPDGVAEPSRTIRIPSSPATGHLRASRSDVASRRAISLHPGPASHGRGRSSFHPAALRAAAEPLTHHPAALRRRDGTSLSNPPDPAPRRALFVPTTAGAWIVTIAITRGGPRTHHGRRPEGRLACIAWLRFRSVPAIAVRAMPPRRTARPRQPGRQGTNFPGDGPSPANAIRPDTATGDFVPSRSSLARPRAFFVPSRRASRRRRAIYPAIRPRLRTVTGHSFPTRPTRPRAGHFSLRAPGEHGS